jgi:ribosomal protein L11
MAPMTVVAVAASTPAASVLWRAVATDNGHLDHVNAFIAALDIAQVYRIAPESALCYDGFAAVVQA